MFKNMVLQTFSVTLPLLLSCILLIPSSYAEIRELSPPQITQIDRLLKDEILLAIPQKTNDTIELSNQLIESCSGKINSTLEACERCATESCDQSSAEEIKKEKKQKLHKVLLPLLFDPLKKTVLTVKIIEKSIGKVLKAIGLKDTEKFLKKFGYVVKDLGKGLLKNAKKVLKNAGKALEKLGKKLANFAEDIGRGLRDSIKKIGKEAKRLGKKVGQALEKIGKGVEKAAKKVIKELPKAIKKITKKVGDIVKKAGKGVKKVVKKVTKPVVKVVKKVGKGVKKVFRKVFGGWGKRSTRYRRLAQCASVCPSCRQVDSTDENVLISNVCGADYLDKRNNLMELLDRIQRVFNASVDETQQIVTKIQYETESSVGFSEYGEVYVTMKTIDGPYKYRSPIPLDAFNLREFAGGITLKVFEKF